MESERKDYELYVHYPDGDQYMSGQPFGDGLRTMARVVDVFKKECEDQHKSIMLRLFGPHGDRKWGFITSYIIHPDGTVIERNDVTIPEPFFSGKKPAPNASGLCPEGV